jgi:hypothetical protein
MHNLLEWENFLFETTPTGDKTATAQSVFGLSRDQATAKKMAEAALKKIVGARKIEEKCFKTEEGEFRWVIFYEVGG